MEIKKSEKANIENGKSTALLIGFVMILALLFVALEWTEREKEIDISGMIVAEISLEEEMIPITLPEKKTVPPPPQSVSHAEVIEIVEDDAEIEETIIASTEDQTEFIDISEVENIVVEEEPEEEAPFMVVEDMPQFPGGDAALVEYLAKNIKYPAICRENNIQGRVLIQFIVNKDGSVVEPEVIKSVNPYLDKEALRVISTMPKWKPGSQRGKPVRVKYTVPVNFRLN
ncbi:MAG: energy transducer TonB [Bacteroidaceae bacterium]|nr:energy transducer TonB [Bacteroidaceae bacterium]MBO7247843.1 energy transducer TonB [Bacteroidaceae bacterium]